jgi:hypothetical protein
MGEEGKNYVLHFFQVPLLHPWSYEVMRSTRHTRREEMKTTVREGLILGGSDPTFSAFSRPSEPWGRSRPSPFSRDRVVAPRSCWRQTICNARCNAQRMTKGGEEDLALLKAPSKQPKTTTLQVRLEEDVRHNLDKYAEFLNANSSYVVSEALKLLFRKDDEFKRWAVQYTNNHKQEQTPGDALTKTA